jgi:small GTP-binding protein
MAWNRKITAILLLAGLAVAGYQLRSFVPNVLAEYQQAASFHPAWGYVYIGVAAVSGLAFVALIVWALWALISNTRAKDRRRETAKLTPGQMSARQRREEIESQLGEGQSLAEDAELPAELREPIRRSLEQLKTKLDKQRLEIVAFGTVSSGKSALLNALAGREVFKSEVRGGTTVARNEIPWPGADQVILVDTPGLAEIKGADREELAKRAARDADLVLFVTDGPLKEFEHQFLEHLAAMEKPVLVCLNKEDWFLPEDRDRLLAQIAEHLEGLVPAENIVALRAQPAARVRTRVLPDGTQCDESVEVEPDIRALADRMRAIVKRDGRDLLLANLLLQSRGLVAEAKAQLQTELDKQAREIVDRSMWQAGAAAALSPLPVIDVVAGAGITSNMVLQLARVYKQKVDLDTIGRLLSEMGKQLLSVAGANVAGPAAGTAIASMLKTVPGVGTIAGGVLQGLVQVLVTRWIGGVFIVYFKREMQDSATDWASLAREQWKQVTRPEELAKLVRMGLSRLGADKE